MRLGVIGLAALLLAACAGGPDVSMGGLGFLRGAPEKVVVAGKSVVIAGPQGYCIDTTATRSSDTGAFVLLGSCASISNSPRAPTPRTPGLLTASVSGTSGAAIGSSLDRLQAFFTSTSGRAALARDGNTASVKILETRRQGEAFYIHARDTSSNSIAGISQDYWRGLFDVRGRIVTVSVVGFETRPMSDAIGLATLDAFAARIKAENPSTEAELVTGPTRPGLFQRLLR